MNQKPNADGDLKAGEEQETSDAPNVPQVPDAQDEPKTNEELRRAPRLRCSGIAGIQTLPACVRPFPATIINLSIGGCLMESERPLTLAENEVVELIFCVNQMPFRVRGRVRAIRSERVVGFQFPQVSDRVRRQLEDLIGELRFPRLPSFGSRRFRHSWLLTDGL
jgi:hypothetical protein